MVSALEALPSVGSEGFSSKTPTPTTAKHVVDDLFPLFDEMKTRLLATELLWVRLKQLEQRCNSLDLTMERLNGRISNWMRRTSVDQEEVTERSSDVDEVTVAEELIRQHLDLRSFPRRHQQQTTT